MATHVQQNTDLGRSASDLLKVLDERSKDVVARRYGLNGSSPETLEAIGREYGITRERVRQIQSQAKKALVGLRHITDPATILVSRVFEEHGGILTEDYAVKAISGFSRQNITPNVIAFFLDLLPPYKLVTRDAIFWPHWRLPMKVNPVHGDIVVAAESALKQYNHPLTEEQLFIQIREVIKQDEQTLPYQHMQAILSASKSTAQTPFGEWGLAEWSETKPRGVGDKAYVVMRRHKQPEHFTKITELINAANFDHKKANAQTVHNELIKDERFVLVGRGLYGLAEWGYMSGTVSDVIEKLLAESQDPLTREEVVKRVLTQRQVKKNTILLGLQNHKRFRKTKENRYTLRRG